ncbi:MAG TPA: FN3 associated domain-containing protein, partial [Candidatus Limnocylindrales bacterium]|nr:FN3 associated domain-containing protein [Candidatus Limnocylindrales bacterium]
TGFNGAGDHFGTKAFAKFNQPMGVAATGGGMLVVADYGNNRVKVVDSGGTVTNLYGVNSSFWVTGAGTYPGWADGTVCAGNVDYNSFGCVEARLPAGVFFAPEGNVYTTEDYYHVIRKVTATGLPQPPPPPPPVPAPVIGWVDFTLPPFSVSILRTNQPFIFNNDVKIAIMGTDGAETHFTFGPTPLGVDTIPDPSASYGATPPPYRDGVYPIDVPPSILPEIMPDVTVKAIGTAPERSPSLVVAARFQFKCGNPLITGDNAALFTVTEQTTNAVMWYTTDGTDPTPAAPSIGPITTGSTISLNASSAVNFKIRAFRDNYQPSDIVSKTFSTDAFIPNSVTFGFSSGEASSDFVGAPGQLFYAPVTLNVVSGTKIYSLQFNVTVTNAGPNPGPAVTPGGFAFQSFLEKPIPGISPPVYERIPPLMFSGYQQNPPPPGQIVMYDGSPFVNLSFTNSSENLLGIGWLERFTMTNLYDTTKQDLIKYSQPHDTLFDEADGKVVLGGYGFQIPVTAQPGQTYQIQIGRPSATSDGIGMPGADVVMLAPTNGAMGAGSVNALKWVTAGQFKYVVGDCAPFRWFNAGDFGNTNLNNSDVEQVFQSAIYYGNYPPAGSDFFDVMDSCGALYTTSPQGYFVKSGTVTGTNLDLLFNGNDQTINQIAFGDGILDVCDVYVTFRRSLDPSLTWFRRFWTNGVLGAEFAANQPGALLVKPGGLDDQNPQPLFSSQGAAVVFRAGDSMASPGQSLMIPINANIYGSFPLRVMMLNLTVVPLDGSPALTVPVQFTPNPALGQPVLVGSTGNGNYAASWLNSTIAGLKGSPTLGYLKVQIPTNATPFSAYAVHFDHASASPNGIASFPKQTTTGLITLADRSTSSLNDGIPDAWRLRYFGTVNNLLSEANADADGDGVDNWQEFIAGTDPTDAKSYLHVSGITGTSQAALDCGVRWPSVAGKQYIIERSADLFAPSWIPVSTNIGSGIDMEFHETTGGNVRFYRVRVAQ